MADPHQTQNRQTQLLSEHARSRWVLSRTDDATVQRRDNMVALTLAGGQLKLIGEKGGGSGHLVWRRDNTVDYITSDRIFGVELGPLR